MASDILAGGFSISGNTASGNATQNNYNIFRDNTINLSGGEDVQHLRSRFLQWLAAPDASFNHHEARSRHVHGTGEWFFQSEPYRAWIAGELPRLWLKGGPGTGKTILCSSTIEAIQGEVEMAKAGVVIYHYFSFSSQEKQTYQGLLLSLISQMVNHSSRLGRLRDACDRNQRHPSLLEIVLLEMLTDYDRIFILIDALDECPTERDDRHHILAGIANLLERGSGIHLLVTGRPEPDIASSLGDMAFHEVDLQQARSKVSSDIDVFIRQTIKSLPRLRGLPLELRQEIQDTLISKADGMFRWVACQIEILRRKKFLTHDVVRKILQDLPVGLDETYNRVFLEIMTDEYIASQARIILQWIVFSFDRPFWRIGADFKTLLVDVCLFKTQHDSTFQPEQRLAMDIVFDHLSPLLRVEEIDGTSRVELAHFTVLEYLLSERIKASVASSFALSESGCHQNMAYTCIRYSLSELEPGELWQLHDYAEKFWTHHQRAAESALPAASFDSSASKLLLKMAKKEIEVERPQIPVFPIWTGDPADFYWQGSYAVPDPTLRAFCCAAYYGLIRTVSCMLKDCADINTIDSKFGTALEAACSYDSMAHSAVLKALVQAGADVNVGGGEHGSPLHTAIECGNWNTTRELLRLGADPHTEDPYFGPVLHHVVQTANKHSRNLDECAVNELVRSGANVNARNAAGDTALQLLCHDSGYITGDLQMLLRHGADVNLHGELGNTALHRACENQPVEAVETLVHAGADVKAVNIQGETPLHVVCRSSDGNDLCNFLKVLLDAGADPNARRSDGATPLHLLCYGNYEDHGAIGRLVSAGAELNTTWPQHGSPFQMAIARAHLPQVYALLKNGVAIHKGCLLRFRHRSGGRELCQGDYLIDPDEEDQIRSQICIALLRPGADTTSFRSVCGPPKLENLLRWFFGIAVGGDEILEMINREVGKELILIVLQAGMSANSEHLRRYLNIHVYGYPEIDVVEGMIRAGSVPDAASVRLACKTQSCWPGLLEILLEAGALVDDAVMNIVQEGLDDFAGSLRALRSKRTAVLSILGRAQQAQQQGQKYVPIYKFDAGFDYLGWPIWERVEARK